MEARAGDPENLTQPLHAVALLLVVGDELEAVDAQVIGDLRERRGDPLLHAAALAQCLVALLDRGGERS